MPNKSTGLQQKSGIKEFEFIGLMAFLMSNVALSIDAILPALPNIGLALAVGDSSQLQLIVTMIFLGLGVGELLFGTLSDSLGRKPIIYAGVGVFVLASILIVFAPNLELFLAGRLLQGIGLSAARSVSIAIIRDTYSGDRMARIMSFIMTIFIVVPMLAPLLGQFILDTYDWKAIFYFQLFFIGIMIVWFGIRQPETLTEENRIPISKHLFTDGLKEYFRHQKTVLYTVTKGFIQGSFIAYLSSAQQIFQEQYEMKATFPYIFGALAFTMGVAALSNGVLVIKYGMLKLVKRSLIIFMITSLTYVSLFMNTPNPSLTVLLVFLSIQFFSIGFISGNLSSLAMQPIGHIAGIGAAISSFISMSLGVTVAVLIGSFIQTTVLPLFIGFCITGFSAIVLISVIQKIK